MSRFYLRLTILLIPLFTLLAVTMSALGSTQPLHPALRGFVEGCEGVPQPCWFGIVPNQTTLSDALNTMALMGYPIEDAEEWDNVTIFNNIGDKAITVGFYSNSFPDRQGDIVAYLYLRNVGDLNIGATLEFFAEPTRIEFSRHNDSFLYDPNIIITLEGHYFAQLTQLIGEIKIGDYFPPLTGIDWRGFAPHWHYCQLQPSPEMCSS